MDIEFKERLHYFMAAYRKIYAQYLLDVHGCDLTTALPEWSVTYTHRKNGKYVRIDKEMTSRPRVVVAFVDVTNGYIYRASGGRRQHQMRPRASIFDADCGVSCLRWYGVKTLHTHTSGKRFELRADEKLNDFAFEKKLLEKFLTACLSSYKRSGGTRNRVYDYIVNEKYVEVVLTDSPDHEPDFSYAFIDKSTGNVFKTAFTGKRGRRVVGNLNNIDRLTVRMRSLFIDDSVLNEQMLLRMADVIAHCRQAYVTYWNARGVTRQAPEFEYIVGTRFIVVHEVYDTTKKCTFAFINRRTGAVFKNSQTTRPVGNIFESYRSEGHTSCNFYGMAELSKQFADFRRYE